MKPPSSLNHIAFSEEWRDHRETRLIGDRVNATAVFNGHNVRVDGRSSVVEVEPPEAVVLNETYREVQIGAYVPSAYRHQRDLCRIARHDGRRD